MNILEKISLDLKLDLTYISRIADRSSFYYRKYTIEKKSGGFREIYQPSAELKTLQYWVVHNVLCALPISEEACAYNKGNSIKKHAEKHQKSKFLFHTDIRNFFPSIHMSHLAPILRANKGIFDKLGLDLEQSIQNIGKICFKSDSLCIGTVSSPIISNIIMYAFDVQMAEYCKAKNYIYTRYADDIYISSTNFIPIDIVSFIASNLSQNGFTINSGKTKFYSTKYRRKITGLIITHDGKVSVGLQKRNEIKKMVYDKLIHNKGDSLKILGYLAFLNDVDPKAYNDIIIKYSQYCSGDIISALNKS